jgi:hypothetical protein
MHNFLFLIFLSPMKNFKPSVLAYSFGLLSLTVLTACSNNGNLSFEEARDLAIHNANGITELLLNSKTPHQQDFTLATTIDDGSGTRINLDLTTQSQQDTPAKKSRTTIAFATDVISE